MNTTTLRLDKTSSSLSAIGKAPAKHMHRLSRIVSILAVSILIGLVALILLVVLRPSEPKALQAFVAVLILSLGMTCASIYGLLITLWSFFITERLNRLKTDEEATLQLSQMREIMYHAVERIADKPEFEATLKNKLEIGAGAVYAPLSPLRDHSKPGYLGHVVTQVVMQYVTMEVLDEAVDDLVPDEKDSPVCV